MSWCNELVNDDPVKFCKQDWQDLISLSSPGMAIEVGRHVLNGLCIFLPTIVNGISHAKKMQTHIKTNWYAQDTWYPGDCILAKERWLLWNSTLKHHHPFIKDDGARSSKIFVKSLNKNYNVQNLIHYSKHIILVWQKKNSYCHEY